MLSVIVIFVQLAASRRYKRNSIWAKTFIDSGGELPRQKFALGQHCFTLLAALKAINTSKFTQQFS